MMEHNKLSVVQVAPPQNIGTGDYYYRVESPGRALSELDEVKTVVSITNIHRNKEELMRDADILILNHLCDSDLLTTIAYRRKKGLVTIFEAGDNINDIQPWNLTSGFWQNEENRSLYYKLVSMCDALQTNNQELLEEFGCMNGRHVIFPNHMNKLSVEKKKVNDEELTIGWGGSYGHLDDLKWVAPVLVAWFKEHPEAKLAIMCSEDIFRIFEEIPAKQKSYYKPGIITEYYDFLKNIDIGIAPLQDTHYNRCRSDIKFVEYAAFRVVPLVQDLAPYNNPSIPGGTRYLFGKPEELIYGLDQLTSNPKLRESIVEKAFEYVKKHRMESQHANRRLEFYSNLLSKAYDRQNGISGILNSLDGYISYEESMFEQNLYNGLIYLETRNMPDKARDLFHEAERLVPDNYLPNLFLSKCVENPIIELQKALQKNPMSLKAKMLIGATYIKGNEAQLALETFKKMIEQVPEYDYPYRKTSEILSLLGMSEGADKLRKIADDLSTRLRNSGESKKVLRKASPTPEKSGVGLRLVMPRGNSYGWGVCGKYLTTELSRLTDVKYITQTFTAEDVGDELDYRLLKSLQVSSEDPDRPTHAERFDSGREVVIQAIQGSDLLPWGPRINFAKKIGYTFFEENVLSDDSVNNAREYFDVVVAGSKWCEEVLQNHGLKSTKTIIQGVDPAIFNTYHNVKEYFRDSFVIFSGGKFELRKGQDLVIRAFKHLQEKYKDVLLVNCWYNPWETSVETMAMSKHINFVRCEDDFRAFTTKILEANGIEHDKVIAISPKPNVAMARIYKNTDIGLFPNRCEGGTNLVLMEYMACGKPTIASFSSGHKDILTEKNSLLINSMKPMTIQRDGNVVAHWDDPDLDEIIAKLEWAYSNREKLANFGRVAGSELSKLTWKDAARQFHELAVSL